MAKELQKGTVICQSGQPVDSIHMIIKGTVRAIYTGGEYFLEKGDVIGLCDLYRQNYIFTYTALDDVTIATFPYKKTGFPSCCAGSRILPRLRPNPASSRPTIF